MKYFYITLLSLCLSCSQFSATTSLNAIKHVSFDDVNKLDSLVVPCDPKRKIESYKLYFTVEGNNYYYDSCRDSVFLSWFSKFRPYVQIIMYDIELDNGDYSNTHFFYYSLDSSKAGNMYQCNDISYKKELCNGKISKKEFLKWREFPLPKIPGYRPKFIARYFKHRIFKDNACNNYKIQNLAFSLLEDQSHPLNIYLMNIELINDNIKDTIRLPDTWFHIVD